MNNQRIQDYINNRLSPAETQKFKEEMSQNPSLQKETEALQALRQAVRSAGLAEPVPNLQPMLAEIARPSRTSWFQKFAPAAIACVAIFGIGVAVNRAVTDQTNPIVASAKPLPEAAHLYKKSPQIMSWQGSDPKEAAAHIAKKFKQPFPTLINMTGAEITGAECGHCWIAYDLKHNGQAYTLYGRKESGNIDQGTPQPYGDHLLYKFQDGIGWYDKGGMTYVLVGGTAEGRYALACKASKCTTKLN